MFQGSVDIFLDKTMWDKLSTVISISTGATPQSQKISRASFPGNFAILLRDIDEGIPVLLVIPDRIQNTWGKKT